MDYVSFLADGTYSLIVLPGQGKRGMGEEMPSNLEGHWVLNYDILVRD